jgi:hypothetical protein
MAAALPSNQQLFRALQANPAQAANLVSAQQTASTITRSLAPCRVRDTADLRPDYQQYTQLPQYAQNAYLVGALTNAQATIHQSNAIIASTQLQLARTQRDYADLSASVGPIAVRTAAVEQEIRDLQAPESCIVETLKSIGHCLEQSWDHFFGCPEKAGT